MKRKYTKLEVEEIKKELQEKYGNSHLWMTKAGEVALLIPTKYPDGIMSPKAYRLNPDDVVMIYWTSGWQPNKNGEDGWIEWSGNKR